MSREPVVIELLVPFADVDEAFAWWMREYDRNPDGQFYDIAKQLKPFVTTDAYEAMRSQFEHPKGETSVFMFRGPDHPDLETLCVQHDRPISPGYCDRYRRADDRPVTTEET